MLKNNVGVKKDFVSLSYASQQTCANGDAVLQSQETHEVLLIKTQHYVPISQDSTKNDSKKLLCFVFAFYISHSFSHQ